MGNAVHKQMNAEPIAMFSKDDLLENSGVCVLIQGVQVAVFYLPAETPSVYALNNWDPLGKANVLYRGIVGDINGELVVASPLYKQHFSLLTGRCLEEDNVQVPVYQARLDGDTVIVTLQPSL
ncbi:MAG: nitrite reductase small subunit NirD [Gammaproteobacteria bacterium]|nr:nitrite reductase small subunit NirD [Gammaproteobacteria bacterium]MDP2141777.1 nitrite reductase small subunit NirD [Gammaproteobacteria bacterium]MDP2347999.1 nitrite reductase small subunit NirD [Gammaproteobacteria bacterium]